MSQQYRVELIDDLEAAQRLGIEWRALLEHSEAQCVFLTPDWLMTWYAVFAEPTDRLCLCAVRNENDRLVGLAPFMIAQRRGLFGSRPFVQFMGTGRACSDYLDVIIDREAPADAVIESIFAHLIQQRMWRGILLSDIVSDSPTLALLGHAAPRYRLFSHREANTICPYLPLPGGWETCLGGLSKHFRKQLKKSLRHTEELGAIEFRLWNGDIEEGYSEFVRLHQSRWEEAGKPGSFAHAKMDEFHQKILPLFRERGWLRLGFLYINGKAVATRLGYTYGGRHYAYQAGYDPEFAEWSVGSVAQMLAIRSEIEEGVPVHDFLRGTTQIKFRWTERYRTTDRLWLIPQNDYALRLELLLHRFMNRTRSVTKRLLPKRLYATLKRLAGRDG